MTEANRDDALKVLIKHSRHLPEGFIKIEEMTEWMLSDDNERVALLYVNKNLYCYLHTRVSLSPAIFVSFFFCESEDINEIEESYLRNATKFYCDKESFTKRLFLSLSL